MSKAKKIIQVFEHQTLKVDDVLGFKERHFKALDRYGSKTKEKYFTVGNNRVKFNNYVGVIRVRDLTIEVLSKADFEKADEEAKSKWHDVLIEMLRVCRLIKLNATTNARLKLKSASILDLYYDLFLTETETIFNHGLRKSYRNTQENLNKVKGKILFTDHIRKNAFHKERFYVSHQVFDADNSAKKKPFRKEGFSHLNCQVAFVDLFDDNDNKKLEKDLGKRIYEELLEEEVATDGQLAIDYDGV